MELKELLEELNTSASSKYEANVEKLLDRMGLERRRDTADVIMPALGIFGAGIAVGATLGVLFAPKRGEELRTELAERLDELREKSSEEYEELRRKSEEALQAARERRKHHDIGEGTPASIREDDGGSAESSPTSKEKTTTSQEG
jgi:gas vesicle protein